jgi:hypothetical protein
MNCDANKFNTAMNIYTVYQFLCFIPLESDELMKNEKCQKQSGIHFSLNAIV